MHRMNFGAYNTRLAHFKGLHSNTALKSPPLFVEKLELSYLGIYTCCEMKM